MTAFVGNVAMLRLPEPVQPFFSDWRKRPLKDETVVFLYLGAIVLRFELADKITTLRVLVALGVGEDGQKFLLDLELLPSELADRWGEFVSRLIHRGLNRPCLVIFDGSKEARAALEQRWPGIKAQHCTAHKLRNLECHTPRHALEEMKADYDRIVHADSLRAAREAYREFVARWRRLAPKAAAILEESGEELLTFYRFPRRQWKSLRSTKAVERLNSEFRRRMKAEGSLPEALAAEPLLLRLLISGQIHLRRIDGWREVKRVFTQMQAKAGEN